MRTTDCLTLQNKQKATIQSYYQHEKIGSKLDDVVHRDFGRD